MQDSTFTAPLERHQGTSVTAEQRSGRESSLWNQVWELNTTQAAPWAKHKGWKQNLSSALCASQLNTVQSDLILKNWLLSSVWKPIHYHFLKGFCSWQSTWTYWGVEISCQDAAVKERGAQSRWAAQHCVHRADRLGTLHKEHRETWTGPAPPASHTDQQGLNFMQSHLLVLQIIKIYQ